MEFFLGAPGQVSRLAVLAGTFNPVTVAHVALGQAGLAYVDEVLFALPRVLPHKPYTGASFEQRIEMLCGALCGQPAFSVAAVDSGLFVEIADECRAVYGDQARLSFLCGRDAAERVAGWDYGSPGAFAAMLRRFDLLVAARAGDYSPPPEFAKAVRTLRLEGDLHHISATDVRKRIAMGDAWEGLVPNGIVELARKIYSRECTRIHMNKERI